MNEPIINAHVFYWIDALSELGDIVAIVTLISCIFGLVMFIISTFNLFYDDDATSTMVWKGVKTMLTVTVISAVVSALIPSKKTMYTMWVGNYITPQNIEMVGESAVDIVDYIFEKVDELQEGR
jgi:hypothetical protein